MVTKSNQYRNWVITTVRTIRAESSTQAIEMYGKDTAKVDHLTCREAKK